MIVNAYDVQVFSRIAAFVGVPAALAAAWMTFGYTAIVLSNMPGWIILTGFALALFHVIPAALFAGFIMRDPKSQTWLAYSGVAVAVLILTLLGWYLSSAPHPDIHLYGPYAAEAAAMTLVSVEALFRKKDYL